MSIIVIEAKQFYLNNIKILYEKLIGTILEELSGVNPIKDPQRVECDIKAARAIYIYAMSLAGWGNSSIGRYIHLPLREVGKLVEQGKVYYYTHYLKSRETERVLDDLITKPGKVRCTFTYTRTIEDQEAKYNRLLNKLDKLTKEKK